MNNLVYAILASAALLFTANVFVVFSQAGAVAPPKAEQASQQEEAPAYECRRELSAPAFQATALS